MDALSSRIGEEARARLAAARVGVAGLGGLGSHIAVMLARSGVGALHLVDFDLVDESNLNRQHYFREHLGRPKTEALAEQLRRIDPGIELTLDRVRVDAGNAAALFAGEITGVLVGGVLGALPGAFDVSAALVALAGVAVLYAYLFLFTDRDMAALSVVIAQSDRFEEACDLIARTAKLSKREAEILPLALRGRTAERIAGEFFISKNTVDTHLRRIYAKCGVHTRQELIDLGERTEAEL